MSIPLAAADRMPPAIADVIYPTLVEGLPSLKGKCIAITGTTSGTGYWSALAVAKKGASALLLLNRQSERAVLADAQIAQEAPDTKVISVVCDLSSFSSVRQAALTAKAHATEFGGIDVLCCNAAIAQMPDSRTVDGYDIQMQTNHLSHALLVEELMPSLEAAANVRAEARVVFHSSGARFFPFTTCEDFGGKHFKKSEPGTLGGDCSTMSLLSLKSAHSVRYNHSKLAMSTYAMALHDKLAAIGSKVKSISAEPGAALTGLIDKGFHVSDGKKANSCALALLVNVTVRFGMCQSGADGACPLLFAACSSEVASGDFFAPSGVVTGLPCYAKGVPTKVVAANMPVAGVKLSEENVLNKEYQKASWEMTRLAIGSS